MDKNYVIVGSSYYSSLEREVNEMIDKGYIPVGGIIVNEREVMSRYSQPMIKKSVIDISGEVKNY